MPLLFNRLSRLVIDILPRSKHLLISWLQSPSVMTLEPKKIKFKKKKKKKDATPWKDSYDQPRLHIQKQRHYFAD